MHFTETELRSLVTSTVARARRQPLGSALRASLIDEARRHYTQASNLAFRARLGGN